MNKKGKCFIIVLLMLFLLCGCQGYRGLDEMVIVTGIAIDKTPENDNYRLTFEIVDLTVPVKEMGLKGQVIESEGKTLFDAVRNAKKRITKKLYFGQAQIIIVSQEIARNEDVGIIVDWFLRDVECRETMCFIISQEETAREMFEIEALTHPLVSTEINNILELDQEVTSTTLCVELYKAFGGLHSEGEELALPVIHKAINNGKTVGETNGMAVFKDNKLVGFLPPNESKYYLFAIDEVKGGILTLSAFGEEHNISLEIFENKTGASFDYKDGKVKVTVKTDTTVYLGEVMRPYAPMDEKEINELEDIAKSELKKNISNSIKKVQSEFGADIYGFGNMIYKKDIKLWKQLAENWEEHFRTLEVEVESEIEIANTASLK